MYCRTYFLGRTGRLLRPEPRLMPETRGGTFSTQSIPNMGNSSG
jgi:hypothetical protein